MDTEPRIDSGRESGFGAEGRRALLEMQRALAESLEILRPYPTRAPEIARELGLDKSLAWKLHRLISEGEPARIAQFVPGASGLQIVLEALRRRGVPRERVAAVESAVELYQRLVRVHGGDRASTQLMLAAASELDRTQLALRRGALRAASFAAGIQARTQLQAFFIAPGRTVGMLDVALVKAYVGVRRLRDDAPFVLGRPNITDDKGVAVPRVVSEPLEGRAAGVEGEGGADPAAELGVMSEFCSRPMPVLRRGRVVGPVFEYEVAEGPVGNTGAFTLVVGEVLRDAVAATPGPGSGRAEHAMQIRVPCGAAILDVFVRRGVFPEHLPTLAVYSEVGGEAFRRGPGRERYRIPGHEAAETIDGGAAGAATADVPRYGALVQRVFERLKWSAAEFELHRARIDSPFIPCAVVMSHPLGGS